MTNKRWDYVTGMSVIKVDIYDASIGLIFDKRTLHRFIKENEIDYDDAKFFQEKMASSVMHCSTDGYADFYLIFNSFEPTVIVHECVHMAMLLLDRKNVKVEPDNDEMLAYLVDYLFTQVTNTLEWKKEEGSLAIPDELNDIIYDEKEPMIVISKSDYDDFIAYKESLFANKEQ